jgi:hypothetical protein
VSEDPPTIDPTQPTGPRKWLRIRSVKLALALFCVGVVALIAAPFAIGFAIERTFQAQGAERVSYQDIDFNPFVGTLFLTRVGPMQPIEGEMI